MTSWEVVVIDQWQDIGGMDKGDSTESNEQWLFLEYMVNINPVEFTNGLDVELREESRMTLRFLPEQLEKLSCYLLK